MSKGKKLVLWLSGSILGVIAISWLVIARLGLASAAETLQIQLGESKKDGLPITADDLKRPFVADDDNAAPLIDRALAQTKLFSDIPTNTISYWGDTWTPHVVTNDDMHHALIEMQPIFEMANRASRRRHLDSHVKWNDVEHISYETLYNLKQLGKLFVRKARFERVSGKPQLAIQSLEVAAKLSHLLSETPSCTALLIRMSMEASVIQQASEALRYASTADLISKLRTVLSRFGTIPDIRFAMKGEFYYRKSVIPQMAFAEDNPSSDVKYVQPQWKLLRIKSISDLNVANSVRQFRMFYDALPIRNDVSYSPSVKTVDQVQRLIESETGMGYIASEALPVFSSSSLDNWIKCVARRRVFAAGLDILELKARNGSFPSAWRKAGVEGMDPFTDKPLSYRRSSSGFVVYSFDVDRKDDEGRPYALYDGTQRTQDVSFEYPKLSHKPTENSFRSAD